MPYKDLIKRRAANRAYAKRHPARVRAAYRKWKGLPLPTHPEPGSCEACGRPRSMFTRGFHLDHDHVTGAFRGWLCARCNRVLGALGDTAEGVRKLLRYIERAELLQ